MYTPIRAEQQTGILETSRNDRILLYVTGMNNIYFIIVRVMIHRSFTVHRKNLYWKTNLIIYILDLR